MTRGAGDVSEQLTLLTTQLQAKRLAKIQLERRCVKSLRDGSRKKQNAEAVLADHEAEGVIHLRL